VTLRQIGNWSGNGDVRVGRTANVLRCGVDGERDTPFLVQVTLHWEPPKTLTGELRVYADVCFRTGHGGADARVDVPSGGTTFTIAGADSVSVQVGAEGDATDSVDVAALAAIVGATQPQPAQRTERHALPADTGVLRNVPGFARGCRVVASDWADLVNVELDYSTQPDSAVRHSRAPVQPDAFIARPNGAIAYSLVQTGGATNNAYVVWELML
jgi:hypothetical protein